MDTNTATESKLQEQIEVTINKNKLQIYGAVMGFLLTIFTGLIWKAVSGIEILRDNSESFKRYIEKNDLQNLYRDKRMEDFEKAAADRLKRIERLEEKEANFWKEYGYLFNQPKR